MGLFINEEWREVNDDSYFKLVFDKNKKELEPGQLGIMKGLKHRQKSRWGKDPRRLCLEMTKSVFGARLGVGVPQGSHQNDSKQLMLMSGAQKVQSDDQPWICPLLENSSFSTLLQAPDASPRSLKWPPCWCPSFPSQAPEEFCLETRWLPFPCSRSFCSFSMIIRENFNASPWSENSNLNDELNLPVLPHLKPCGPSPCPHQDSGILKHTTSVPTSGPLHMLSPLSGILPSSHERQKDSFKFKLQVRIMFQNT